MIEWFRTETDIRSNRKFVELGMSLRLPRDVARAASLGFYMALLANVADHKPDGVIADVPDEVVEDWAGWRGEPSLFATEFRRIFTSDGEITGWQKRQGKLIATQEAKKQADRDRISQKRRSDVAATESRETRDKNTYGNGNSNKDTTTQHTARERFIGSLPIEKRRQWDSTLTTWLGGDDLPPGLRATEADIESGLGDFLRNGKGDTASRFIRKHVENAIRDRLRAEAAPPITKPIGAFTRPNGKVGRAEQTYMDARVSVGLPPHPEDDRVDS